MVKKQKHEEKSELSFIIVGPMDFSPVLLSSYKDGVKTKLFFIDGGLRHQELLAEHFPESSKNALSLGDGDSSPLPMKMKKLDQNVSDLSYFLSSLGAYPKASTYHFIGFVGGRVDHFLFNLGELSACIYRQALGSKALVLMDNSIQFLGIGEHVLIVEGTFSIASLQDNKIKIQGDCEFESREWIKLPVLSSRGLSNVGYGVISVESIKPFFIIYH